MKFVIGLIPTLVTGNRAAYAYSFNVFIKRCEQSWEKTAQPTEKIKGEKAYSYINVLSSHFCRAALDLFKAVSLREKKMLLAGIIQRRNYNT